jgi:AMIN domain
VRVIAQLNLVLLFASIAAAQIAGGSVAKIQNVSVTCAGDEIRIEVGLNALVKPNIIRAAHPDRLVLELPHTIARAKQRRIAVNQNGVKTVRIGLNRTNPLVTRMVVDLTRPRAYELTAAENKIILTVLGAAAGASIGRNNDGALPAASAPGLGKLWPWQRHENRRPAATSATSIVRGRTKTVSAAAQPAQAGPRTTFKVKYVAEGAAYLDGGRSSGLAEGMKLLVRNASPASAGSTTASAPAVAELQVVSVAETSAVTEIHASKRDVKPGDWAYLSAEDSERLSEERTLSSTTRNLQTSSFLSNQTSTQSPGRSGPQPLSAEESRLRARIGFDYSGIRSGGSTLGSSGEIGVSFQADMTRIAGTHWNLQGYWRDRITTNSQPAEQTIQDYLDRTYIIQLFYDNPDSKWVAGVGRLYLPWAASLDTIDGGYVGRRIAHGVTAGVFGGSTPDPASWHYRPNQQTAGSFINFESGSYDSFHYTSTSGVAFDMLKWQLDRPYLFFENGVSYGTYLSVYHSLIVDSPQGVSTDGIKPGTGISRSYLTFHLQPERWIGFDVYHNYFRDTPTAAAALIGTGLVDKLLYQGVNVGVRIEPVRRFAVYTTIGQSDKTGDARRSLNQMYGVTWSDIGHTGIRADLHYSKFDSSFARGDYRVLSLTRHLGDRMLWDTQVGSQTLLSTFTANNKSIFVDTSLATNLGKHSFVQSGIALERGAQLNYEQWYLSLGYRFDVKGPAK